MNNPHTGNEGRTLSADPEPLGAMDFVYDVACDLYGKGQRQGEMDIMKTCSELVRSAFELLLDTNMLYLDGDIVTPRISDSVLMEQCAADEVSDEAGQECDSDGDINTGGQPPLGGQDSFEDLARDFILRQCAYILQPGRGRFRDGTL